MKFYKTNISQTSWCSLANGVAKFETAEIQLEEHDQEKMNTIGWFDKLFKKGLKLPEEGDKPLTMLVTGPPGSGKTTLVMELCYRLARKKENHNGEEAEFDDNSLFSLYISTDQEAKRIIDNARSYGYRDVDLHIVDFKVDSERPEKHDVNRVAVWGKDEIRDSWEEGINNDNKLSTILEAALEGLADILIGNNLSGKARQESKSARDRLRVKLFGNANQSNILGRLKPDIIVIDSLNIVNPDDQQHFFQKFLNVTSSSSKMVIFVLDSASAGDTHEMWEYACDTIVRLDYGNTDDYYLRTIEVVKARYQSHVWGQQQLKIYGKPTLPDINVRGRNDIMRRSHPYRTEGGIFIYPSIHYYLSLYKRRGPTEGPKYAKTWPELTGVLERGLPEGRCTAFIGSRGGHKSHFGYLHLLNRLLTDDEAALVISLRDDEKMTMQTMGNILETEFPQTGVTLQNLREGDRLEVLYYHPGNITPEEFFHRMFISMHRLKRRDRKLTVLFNSLDQLRSRFPLCAKQEIFIPGIIEFLTGEEATSIFIAVDEPGQPVEQYGLLPMADLILSFYPRRFTFHDYYKHLNEVLKLNKVLEQSDVSKLDKDQRDLKERIQKLKREPAEFIEEIVLQVVRFAGGQRAGAQGLLELVDRDDLGLYKKPGLHFTKLSPKYDLGTPLFPGERT